MICIVGRGVLGRALARALRQASMRVLHVRGRAKLPATIAHADVVILAVRDDAISQVAARVPTNPTMTVLHCAGAYAAAELLGPVAERVREIGSLHPLLAVSPTTTFRSAVFAVEGKTATRLARRVGGHPITLRAGSNALYHAAAVLSAGHLVALLDTAIGVAMRAGLSRRAARTALSALAQSALDQVRTVDTRRALTGPIARGDATVVLRHLQALPPPARALYVELAKHALHLSQAPSRDQARLRTVVETPQQ